MSYLAIARKHRPKTFEEMAGQSHVTRTLKNAIQRGRIHHAYLFSGPRGVGKTTTARALARAINCDAGPTITPCGVCSNCEDILSGDSTDVVEIDGASNNSVDDIRQLRDKVQFLPAQGRKRIYIIDEVHMLSKGAFNALLKTLEEPPPHVMFMFATTEPHKLPETILSRVQRFEFTRIPLDVVVERLQLICELEGYTVEDGGLRLIARAGEGSMRDSQSLLDQVFSFGETTITTTQVAAALGLIDRGLLYQMLRGLVNQDAELCLDSIEQVYRYGYDLSEFSAEMLEILRNATVAVLSPKTRRFLDIPEDEQETLIALAEQSSADVFTRSFQVMLNVHEQVARSPRPKLALEMAVARLVSIRAAVPIDSMLDKISRLEAGGRQMNRRQQTQQRQPRISSDDGEDDPAPESSPAVPSVPVGGPPNRYRHGNRSERTAEIHQAERTPKSQQAEPKAETKQPVISPPPVVEKAQNKRPVIKPPATPERVSRPSRTQHQTPTASALIEDLPSDHVRSLSKLLGLRDFIIAHGETRHQSFAETIAIERQEGHTLYICSSEGHIFQANQKLIRDPLVLRGMQRIYEASIIKHRHRPTPQLETVRDYNARKKHERQIALEQSYANDNRVQQLLSQFGGQIGRVTLKEDLN